MSGLMKRVLSTPFYGYIRRSRCSYCDSICHQSLSLQTECRDLLLSLRVVGWSDLAILFQPLGSLSRRTTFGQNSCVVTENRIILRNPCHDARFQAKTPAS